MSVLLSAYAALTRRAKPLMEHGLTRRCQRGKEDPQRLEERKGTPSKARPKGALLWLHGASVGESLSTLILIEAIRKAFPDMQFLLTSGTVTSANLMEKRLPPYAIHQYIPLDQPDWVARFLDHWKPQAGIWMESELWPNLAIAAHARAIPLFLVNARLSNRSYRRWSMARGMINEILKSFSLILTQTQDDATRYQQLGHAQSFPCGNIKYSAAPLPFDKVQYDLLHQAIAGRPVWIYASTHEGEETLSCRVHRNLKERIPGLLTIIVPRHIDRRDRIAQICEETGLDYTLRGENKSPPRPQDDIYIADTMGELGLFYKLSAIAMIGRSFSDDGGGGHNPVEAAQLDCAVLTGPNVQYQREMFDDMFAAGAARQVHSESQMRETLYTLLHDPEALRHLQESSFAFAKERALVIDHVMDRLLPHLKTLEQRDAA